MYASLRTYRIGSGSVDAVMRRVDRDFAEALSQEPGSVAYHAIDTGNDMVMTISLFHDREQAEASNELAASACSRSWNRLIVMTMSLPVTMAWKATNPGSCDNASTKSRSTRRMTA